MCIRDRACRDAGVTAEMDHQHRSLKSQFKLADKVGSRMVAVLGPDELAAGEVKVRKMCIRDRAWAIWWFRICKR